MVVEYLKGIYREGDGPSLGEDESPTAGEPFVCPRTSGSQIFSPHDVIYPIEYLLSPTSLPLLLLGFSPTKYLDHASPLLFSYWLLIFIFLPSSPDDGDSNDVTAPSSMSDTCTLVSHTT